MDTNKDEIDKLFSAKFEKFEIQSSPEDWELLSSKMNRVNFWKFHFNGFNIYYLAALLGIAGIITWLVVTNIKNSEQINVIQDSAGTYKDTIKDTTRHIPVNSQSAVSADEKKVPEKVQTPKISTTSKINNQTTDTITTKNKGAVESHSAITDTTNNSVKTPVTKTTQVDSVKQVKVKRIKKTMTVKPEAVVVRDTVNLTKRTK